MFHKSFKICIVLSLWLSGCSKLSSQTASNEDQSPKYAELASFHGAGFTDWLYISSPESEPELYSYSFEDVGGPAKICNYPGLYLCIEEPFALYLPDGRKTLEFLNALGERIDMKLFPIGEHSNSMDMCEMNQFWVTIENHVSGIKGGFNFQKNRGLVAFFIEFKFDGRDFEPAMVYSLDEGRVFNINLFCK